MYDAEDSANNHSISSHTTGRIVTVIIIIPTTPTVLFISEIAAITDDKPSLNAPPTTGTDEPNKNCTPFTDTLSAPDERRFFIPAIPAKIAEQKPRSILKHFFIAESIFSAFAFGEKDKQTENNND